MSTPLFSSMAMVTAIAFAIAAIVTPMVRAIARRAGAVAQPKSDRWHTKPTAMFGGAAIFIAVVTSVLLFVPHSRDRWTVIAASAALFAVGMVDDILQIKPYQKLIGQLLGASGVVYLGLVLPWTGSFALNMMITFLWLIGITNAVNMLDNMDGLAAGVSAIAAFFLALNFYINGQTGEALMLCAFAGALLGFLLYNHHRASIFMGDCGSMFVGFFLSSSALLASFGGGGRSRSVVAVLAVPVLVLVIPIFDTTFVTLMRKMAGRAASQGGRDHTSHRLVALGLSERSAVWMLYAFALLAGTLAMIVRQVPLDVSVATIIGFVVVLTFLGVHLGRVRVYEETEIAAAREKPIVAFLVDLSHKRRVFEVALDVVLIVLAYYATHVLLFGPVSNAQQWALFLKTVPAVVFVQLATFLATGVYRGIWRYASLADVAVYARAVVFGEVATILTVVFLFHHMAFVRSIFVLDALILMTLVTTSRFAFRLLRKLFPAPHSRTGRRVLIYGAGDAGELLYRELNNNPALNSVAVGFIDDDPRKTGKLLHGLRVYGGNGSIGDICRSQRVEAVVLSTWKLTLARVREVAMQCAAEGVAVERMDIGIRPLSEQELSWVLPSDAEPAHDSRSPIMVMRDAQTPVAGRPAPALRPNH